MAGVKRNPAPPKTKSVKPGKAYTKEKGRLGLTSDGHENEEGRVIRVLINISNFAKYARKAEITEP